VTAMTFSPDGKTLATGSQDTTVVLWDVSEAK
jgi:WD40 repeat protein